MKNYKILTLEEALSEGKKILFPAVEPWHCSGIAKDMEQYLQIVKRMYSENMAVGIKLKRKT